MKLAELLAAAGVPPTGVLPDAEVTGVTEDSRAVKPGAVFVAIPGTRRDGSAYAADAMARGAVAIVAARAPEPDASSASSVPWLVVADARQALARLAAGYHGNPGARMVLHGVTGSKGKTTTSYLMAAVSETAGTPTALLGTIVYRTSKASRPAPLTTPSATLLHEVLAEAASAGDRAAVLEVSSHALDQDRVYGLGFESGVFTNLFPDHLDYHPTVDHYFEAKRKLFTGPLACRRAIIGIDGRYGSRLAGERSDATTFGATAEADVRPITVDVSRQGTRVLAELPGGQQVLLDSPLLGRFNAANLLAAAAWAVALGIEIEAIREGVRRVERVPGRMEPVECGQPFTCLVDFSHTGAALRAALEAAREWTSGRVLAVFGAGGNRDRTRRTTMGEAAAELAHEVFLTSDNPRDEDPRAILSEIEIAYRRASGGEATILPDRREAIAAAVAAARPGDTVVVAGKGHETEQIARDTRTHFDDREVLAEALRARGFSA